MRVFSRPPPGRGKGMAMSDNPVLDAVFAENRLLRETLRDQFAIAALIGQLACSAPIENREEPYKETAEISYMLADEMLKARARPGAGAP